MIGILLLITFLAGVATFIGLRIVFALVSLNEQLKRIADALDAMKPSAIEVEPRYFVREGDSTDGR